TFNPAFCSSNIIGGSIRSMPIGMLPTPASRMSEAISSACRSIRPKAGATVPRMPMSPGLAILRPEPGRGKLVMPSRRAAVPKDGMVGGGGEQGEAARLAAPPFADLGRGEVADVVDVEDEQRAQLGLLQRRLDAAEPVAM